MTTVESLKNRLEEIRTENRTLAKRQRPIEEQTHDLFFEAGFEAAINFLQQNLQQCNVGSSAANEMQCADCGKKDETVKKRSDGYGYQCYSCYKADKYFDEEYR